MADIRGKDVLTSQERTVGGYGDHAIWEISAKMVES